MDEGDKKTEAKDFAGALKAYQAAHALVGVPTTGIEVVKAMMTMGQLVEARDFALTVSRLPQKSGEPGVFGKARKEAADLAEKLEPRIPSLRPVIKGRPESVVEVEVDDAVIPRAAVGLPRNVNPGKHHVTATADDGQSASVDVTLEEGETMDATLVIGKGASVEVGDPDAEAEKRGARAPSHDAGTGERRPFDPALVYGGFGAGGLGVVVGTITGIMSLSKASTAKKGCKGDVCPLANESAAHSSESLAIVSDIAFAVGIVGGGVGLYGILSARPPEASAAKPTRGAGPHVDAVIGAHSVGLVGTF